MKPEITETIALMPVYEDRQCARKLLGEIADQLADGCYVCVIEDGSVNDPVTIGDITQHGLSGEVIHLARNVGHQRAIAIGLTHIAATLQHSNVVVMDCDGEDRPDTIPILLSELQSGNVDAVVAQRRRRSDTLTFRLFYNPLSLRLPIADGAGHCLWKLCGTFPRERAEAGGHARGVAAFRICTDGFQIANWLSA